MKRIFFLLTLFAVVSCTSKTTTPSSVEQPSESERILQRVMLSVFDSTVTLFDVKSDLYQFIDTMYAHAAYHPDIDIRIGAKSMTSTLIPVFLDTKDDRNKSSLVH